MMLRQNGSAICSGQLASCSGSVLLLAALMSFGSALQAASPNRGEADGVQAARQAGIQWLLQQQGADGDWRSDAYGSFRGGVTLTALALLTLSEQPDAPAHRDASEEARSRAIRFLSSRVGRDGFLEDPDDVDSHAIYSTAMFLSALALHPTPETVGLRRRLASALTGAQRTSAHGWTEQDSDWGGWGPIREVSREQVGDVPANVSATAVVLTALKQARALTPDVRTQALVFLGRCRSGDGSAGSWFTPQVDHPLNKAGWTRQPDGSLAGRPYHSATCDSFLAVAACGEESGNVLADKDSETVRQHLLEAIAYLSPPQFPLIVSGEEAAFRTTQGVYFYDASVLSAVWLRTRDDRLKEQKHRVDQDLVENQLSDGSWKSPLLWMREDDRLIATCLALRALR